MERLLLAGAQLGQHRAHETEAERTDPNRGAGPAVVGLTAGASTPNNVVGEVVERLLALRGLTTDQLVGA